MTATTVLVVDTHQVVADAIASVIDGLDEVTAVAAAASATAIDARAADADLLVVSSTFHGDDSLRVVDHVRAGARPLRTIVLADRDETAELLRALDAGVDGFVSKAAPVDAVVAAVRTVLRGGRAFTADAMHRADLARAERDTRRAEASTGRPVSDREVEILTLLAGGASTREIAEHLFVSVNTVRTHVQNIFRKLGASSRLEAVSIAISSGLVDEGARTPHAGTDPGQAA